MLFHKGIGVPIMLAYVYGVVPISLCRSGGCGVSAGNGKGVRIEFDDENDNIGSGAAATGELLFLLWCRRGDIARLIEGCPVTEGSLLQSSLPLWLC